MRCVPKVVSCALLVAAVALTAAPGAPAGAAQKKERPATRLAIEAVNDHPAWAVRVTLDRPDGRYPAGSTIVADVVSEKDGFLYLFNIDAEGEISVLFPNYGRADNAIKAKNKFQVGGAGDVPLEVTAQNDGVEYIKAIVTKERIPALDALIKKATKANPLIELTPKQFEEILREVAFGDSPKAPNSGDLRRDLREWKREMLVPGKVVPKGQQEKAEKEFKAQTQSWAEHQVKIYTGKVIQPKPAQRLALVVGIDKYKSGNIRPLKCAVKDADAIEKLLNGPGRFDAVVKLTDERATLEGIQTAFDELVAKSRPGDTVVVYWAGHGGRCSNTDGTEPDGFDEFLVPHDGSLQSDAAVRQSMLLDKVFGRWIAGLSERKVMVILDTCHSGGQVAGVKFPPGQPNPDGSPRGARGINTPQLPAQQKWTKRTFIDTELNRYMALGTRNIKRTDAAVLAACAPMQFAFERVEGTNGVLTSFIIEAFEDKNLPENLTLRDVFKYVDERVQDYVKMKFPGSPQNPVFADDTKLDPAAYLRVRP